MPWAEEQKLAFLTQQFEAQDKDYRENYGDGDFLVIEVDGRDAGRLYVQRSMDELLIIDIALLPTERGKGIGTRILGDLLREADEARRKVSIHVEHFNPALRLYERLGFRMVEEVGIHFRMVHDPT